MDVLTDSPLWIKPILTYLVFVKFSLVRFNEWAETAAFYAANYAGLNEPIVMEISDV